MSFPPFLYTVNAEDMSTGKFSKVVHVVSKADNTFSNSNFFVAEKFSHSSSYTRFNLIFFIVGTKV